MESKLKKLLKDICEEQSLKTKHIKEPKNLKEKVTKRKGFHLVEIDNDNGMCNWDYGYNDL